MIAVNDLLEPFLAIQNFAVLMLVVANLAFAIAFTLILLISAPARQRQDAIEQSNEASKSTRGRGERGVNKITGLFFGVFFLFGISWLGLVAYPYLTFAGLRQSKDDATGALAPLGNPGTATQGARVYAANGCCLLS